MIGEKRNKPREEYNVKGRRYTLYLIRDTIVFQHIQMRGIIREKRRERQAKRKKCNVEGTRYNV